jgi:flagellar biosynthesis/type III secretory pathway M-ring protein FliF/YscJ
MVTFPHFIKLELIIVATLLFLFLLLLLIFSIYLIQKMRKEKAELVQKIQKTKEKREMFENYLDEITSPNYQVISTEPGDSSGDSNITEPLMTKECPYCGSLNELDARICTECGLILRSI